MKIGKQQMIEEKERPNQGKIRMLRINEIYKYFGILEAGAIKQEEMKKQIKKEYHRWTRKQHETKTTQQKSHNKYLVCPLCKILRTILKVMEELQQMD